MLLPEWLILLPLASALNRSRPAVLLRIPLFTAGTRASGAVRPPIRLPLTPSPSVDVFRGGFIGGRPPRKLAARGEGGHFLVLVRVLAPSRLSQREPVRGRVAF